MNKKRNNIKILLIMTMALSAFSLNTNAMENKQNATKPNILNKFLENKKPENNIFENLNSNNKLKKSNSVENINNNLSLNENKQKDNDKDIKKINFKLKDINSTNFDNLLKPNILNKSFEDKKPENNVFENLNSNNINNNLTLNEDEKKYNKYNKKINRISQNNIKFKTMYENSEKKISNKQEYEELIKNLDLIMNNMEELDNLIYDLQYSKKVDIIIEKEIPTLISTITNLKNLIKNKIENNDVIDENLLNSTEQSIRRIISLLDDLKSDIEKSYRLYNIYLKYYKDSNKEFESKLEYTLSEEEIELCKEIEKNKTRQNYLFYLLTEIEKKAKETQTLIEIKKLEKNNFLERSKNEINEIIKKIDDNKKNCENLSEKIYEKKILIGEMQKSINEENNKLRKKIDFNIYFWENEKENDLRRNEKLTREWNQLESYKSELKFKEKHIDREKQELQEKNEILEKKTKIKFSKKKEEDLKIELVELMKKINEIKKEQEDLREEDKKLSSKENHYNLKIFFNIKHSPTYKKVEVIKKLIDEYEDIVEEITKIEEQKKQVNIKTTENDLEKLEKTQVKSNTQINTLNLKKDIDDIYDELMNIYRITNNIVNNMENELKPNQQEPLKIDEKTIEEYQKILNKIKREIAMINDNTNKNNTLDQLKITKNVLNNNLKKRLNSLNETLNKKYGIENQIKNSIDMNSAYSDIENLTKKIDNLISNFKK